MEFLSTIHNWSIKAAPQLSKLFCILNCTMRVWPVTTLPLSNLPSHKWTQLELRYERTSTTQCSAEAEAWWRDAGSTAVGPEAKSKWRESREYGTVVKWKTICQSQTAINCTASVSVVWYHCTLIIHAAGCVSVEICYENFWPTPKSFWLPRQLGVLQHSQAPPAIRLWSRTNNFCTDIYIYRPMNALQICRWQFSHKETLQQTFFKRSVILQSKQPFCGFQPPLGGLGSTYDVHLMLIGKRAVDFLLVLSELFSLGVTADW